MYIDKIKLLKKLTNFYLIQSTKYNLIINNIIHIYLNMSKRLFEWQVV